MNVLLVTIDSLRRDFLGAYADRPNCLEYDVETPNLDRFAERAAVFENHYAGSLPCMPARREFSAGVQEFLWRPWGPAEPFDVPVPELVGEAGGTTQLITDHYHYLEYGGRGYHEPYDGVEFVRGHEFDAWRTAPREPDERLLRQTGVDDPTGDRRAAYARNVDELDELDEREFFAPRVFSRAADWLRENRERDPWFCYVDSFDVHEPFHCPEPYASLYTDEDPTDPDRPVWPEYATVEEQGLSERDLAFVRSQFAGKVTMVDRWFGRVLDALDRQRAWDETAVIVTTDHGYLLGEHGWTAKNVMPTYDEVAHTPLLVWLPGAERNGERVRALTSAVDVYPTLLEAADVPIPEHAHGRSLAPLLRGETDPDNHREWALYGYFGAGPNVTDGRYTYLHPGPDEGEPVSCYSTVQMPRGREKAAQPQATAGSVPYADAPVWRYPLRASPQNEAPLLFDTAEDPRQEENLVEREPETVERMRDLLRTAMAELEAPDERFDRFGLEAP